MLSEEAIENFGESILFENKNLLGFNTSYVLNELDEETYSLFFQKVFHLTPEKYGDIDYSQLKCKGCSNYPFPIFNVNHEKPIQCVGGGWRCTPSQHDVCFATGCTGSNG